MSVPLPPLNKYDRRRAFWRDHPWARLLAKLLPSLLFLLVLTPLLPSVSRDGLVSALSGLAPPTALALSVVLMFMGAYEKPDGSREPLSTSSRIKVARYRLGNVEKDLTETLEELDRLHVLATELEVAARDRQAIASMTNEQVEALLRQQSRSSRQTVVLCAISIVGGAFLWPAVSNLWRVWN